MTCEFCGAPAYRIYVNDIPNAATALASNLPDHAGPEEAMTCRLHEQMVRDRHEPIRVAYRERRPHVLSSREDRDDG